MSEKLTQNWRELTPYIGRDYKSGKQAKEAFLAGYDFYLQPEALACSVRDFGPGVRVILRFKQNQNTTTVIVPMQEPKNIAIGKAHDKFMVETFGENWKPKRK